MTITIGPDPQQPIPLTCIINSGGGLEVKHGNDSLTHPQPQDLLVRVEDPGSVTFRASDFYAGSVQHTVGATTVGGSGWDDGGSTIVSSALASASDPGQLHEVDVSATNTSNNQTQTVRIRIRIREEPIRPFP